MRIPREDKPSGSSRGGTAPGRCSRRECSTGVFLKLKSTRRVQLLNVRTSVGILTRNAVFLRSDHEAAGTETGDCPRREGVHDLARLSRQTGTVATGVGALLIGTRQRRGAVGVGTTFGLRRLSDS